MQVALMLKVQSGSAIASLVQNHVEIAFLIVSDSFSPIDREMIFRLLA